MQIAILWGLDGRFADARIVGAVGPDGNEDTTDTSGNRVPQTRTRRDYHPRTGHLSNPGQPHRAPVYRVIWPGKGLPRTSWG